MLQNDEVLINNNIDDISNENSIPHKHTDAIPFSLLLANKALNTVPSEQILTVIQAIRHRSELHSFNDYNHQHNSFPLNDLFSGKVIEISHRKVAFPKFMKMNDDYYIVVYVAAANLYIYVPSHLAGINRPRILSNMQGQYVSVVITNLLSYGKSQHGNFAPMVAVGSIQYAEYEVGKILQAEFVHNYQNFVNYERKGIITDIDDVHNHITVNLHLNVADAANQIKYAYISTTLGIKDIGYPYKWQKKISDFDFVKVGNTINCQINQVIPRVVKDELHDRVGEYTQLICSRLNLADVKNADEFLLNKIVSGATFKAYLYSISSKALLLEIAPEVIVQARIAPRHLQAWYRAFKEELIKTHQAVDVQLDKRITSIKQIYTTHTPVAIVGTATDYINHDIANNLGNVELVSFQDVNKINKNIQKMTSRKKLAMQKNKEVSRALKTLAKYLTDDDDDE